MTTWPKPIHRVGARPLEKTARELYESEGGKRWVSPDESGTKILH